jgi:hypothetical protein
MDDYTAEEEARQYILTYAPDYLEALQRGLVTFEESLAAAKVQDQIAANELEASCKQS